MPALSLSIRRFLILFFLCLHSLGVFASDGPIQWGADKSVYNRKTKWTELRGNAYVIQDNEVIRADNIDVDLENKKAHAWGNAFYQIKDLVMLGEDIEVDLVLKTGVTRNGNISNGRYALRGKKIIRTGDSHYDAEDFEYTTCVDCAPSWKLTGKSLDLTVEKYAYIKDFIFNVKDASAFWLPFLAFPVKTRRESGLLFPRFGLNAVYGSFFVQPVFFAVNDHLDFTLGVGSYSEKGLRLEVEGRYALTSRSQGLFSVGWTKDKGYAPGIDSRMSRKIFLTQELPWGMEAKLRYFDVSDSGVPIEFLEDIPGRFEPVLASDLFISRNNVDFSTLVAIQRLRNLLYFDSSGRPKPGFDSQTVQEVPKVVVNTNDRYIAGTDIAVGLEARFNRFARAGSEFDTGTINGQGFSTIREASRFSLIPTAYTHLHPTSWLNITPSVQYRAFLYDFDTRDPAYRNLLRGYLLSQTEASFQIERVYSTDTPGEKYKHLIRPLLTYSLIPMIQESADHEFSRQVQNRASTGQYFDNWDIVPLGASQSIENFFTPLGNSLTYGFVTQVFHKKPPAYSAQKKMGAPLVDEQTQKNTAFTQSLTERRFELSARQTFDIREAQRIVPEGQRDNRILLSPIFANMTYSRGSFSWSNDYAYFVNLSRYAGAQLVANPSPHRWSSGLTWTFERGFRQNILYFERSLSLGYAFSKLTSKTSSLRSLLRFSINDYVMPTVGYTFDLVSAKNALLESRYGLMLQNPSKCWRIEFAMLRSIDRGYGITMQLGFNLTGIGWGSFDQGGGGF